MNIGVYNKTKENVARALGVAKFADAAKVNAHEREKMVARAQKELKIRCHTRTRDLSSGNPYIMLGRKVNTKGKLVK